MVNNSGFINKARIFQNWFIVLLLFFINYSFELRVNGYIIALPVTAVAGAIIVIVQLSKDPNFRNYFKVPSILAIVFAAMLLVHSVVGAFDLSFLTIDLVDVEELTYPMLRDIFDSLKAQVPNLKLSTFISLVNNCLYIAFVFTFCKSCIALINWDNSKDLMKKLGKGLLITGLISYVTMFLVCMGLLKICDSIELFNTLEQAEDFGNSIELTDYIYIGIKDNALQIISLISILCIGFSVAIIWNFILNVRLFVLVFRLKFEKPLPMDPPKEDVVILSEDDYQIKEENYKVEENEEEKEVSSEYNKYGRYDD